MYKAKNTTDTYTLKEAQKKLEYYCAYQERCHSEVVKKLKEMKMIPEAIDHIVTHLIQENYLNEERFAKSFAMGKFRQKYWGKPRIERELKLRGISYFNLKIAMNEISDFEYEETLKLIASKKWEALGDCSLLKKKKKLFDYLKYRGWENHLIFEQINMLEKCK